MLIEDAFFKNCFKIHQEINPDRHSGLDPESSADSNL
jgi:hypothetical protein